MMAERNNMQRVTSHYYTHRGVDIVKIGHGITVDLPGIELNLYRTYEDARQAINKYLDSSNTKEPRIIEA
jgi:hypothetical protein